MEVIYKADDGTGFYTYDECRQYEDSKKKKTYAVSLTYEAYIHFLIDATNEQEAREIAKKRANETYAENFEIATVPNKIYVYSSDKK